MNINPFKDLAILFSNYSLPLKSNISKLKKLDASFCCQSLFDMNSERVFSFTSCVLSLLITSCLFILFIPTFISADERILSFQAIIMVNPDGSLLVEENIQVRAESREIRRGIYRDFPLRYRDPYGNKYKVDFSIISILRDGKPESYHTKNIADGIRIYIGQENVFLSPGIYKYTISYRTDRQLGFFKEHDELYWNVTGNYWSFPIERASAVIFLPDNARNHIKLLNAFTGPIGSQGKDFKVFYDHNKNPVFETTRLLGVGEGLTIVIGWEKGFVSLPSTETKIKYFINDNREIIIAFFGICLVLIYYLLSWLKVGKDPEKDTIVTLYEPPKGYSPASMRYIYKMGYDNKSFAAALINMAVKGAVKIHEENDSFGYEVKKTGKDITNLSPDEMLIYSILFRNTKSVSFNKSNNQVLRTTISEFKEKLKTTYEKIYFFSNKGYFIVGLIASFSVAVASIFLSDLPESTIFLSIWLTFWSIGIIFLSIQLVRTWRAIRHSARKIRAFLGAAFFTAFCLPFIGAEIAVFVILIKDTSVLFGTILLALGAINYLFYHLLKSPTLRGRKLMDKIEGFRLFLDATEKDRLNMLNAPYKTPELFEKYLPYAVALDVENRWAQQFESILRASTEESSKGYTPRWYSDSLGQSPAFASFGSSIGDAIADSVSSAASPGSSSGSGGSSGGGGGGW